MKNTIENKINDESKVIEQNNSRLPFKKKNTIDKINDESDVIEQKNLRFLNIEKYH